MVLTMMLLDSSLLVSAAIPHQRLTPTLSSQSNASTPIALLASPAGFWSLADGRYLSANVTTQGEIMAYILTNPGVYLREIGQDLGLAVGVVQYHTWVLSRNGEIEDCKKGRYRRFFGAGKYEEEERMVISLLRQATTGRILTALSGNEPLTHMKLAKILGLSSQALTWQMKRLKDAGIVERLGFQGRQGGAYCLLDGIAPIVRSQINHNVSAEANPVPVPSIAS